MIDRFTRIDKLRMYAHKVLPLVYDDSLSYYEYLCKVVQKVNEVIEQDNEQSTTIEEFGEVLEEMQKEIDESLESMQGQIDEAVHDAEEATEAALGAKDAADLATEAANTAAEHAEATAVKYGTPYAVTSSTDMTDHDYIYVYTGSTGGGFTKGNWYYWNGTAWTSGGVYVGDITDAVLFNTSQSKSDAEKAQARENCGAADGANFEDVYSINRFNGEYTPGYFVNQTNGNAEALATHAVTDYIDISNRGSANVVVSQTHVNNLGYANFRYCFYDSTKTFISGSIAPTLQNNAGLNRDYAVLTTPTNAVYMRFSQATAAFTMTNDWQIQYTSVTKYYPYTGDYKAIKSSSCDNGLIKKLISATYSTSPSTVSAETFEADTTLKIEQNSIFKNQKITFFAKVGENFGSVWVGHGTGSYGYYIIVDGTNMSYASNGSVGSSFAHGLTISEFIGVSINIDKNLNIKTVITTAGGTYSKTAQINSSWRGDVFAKCVGYDLEDATLTWHCDDYKCPLWAFGDSYFTIYSDTRWTYYVVKEWNNDNCLLNAYPGENSSSAYVDLLNALEHGRPKYLFWCLGMNDSDVGTSPNASWLQTVNNIKEICDAYEIELILATIPLVSTVENTYKNNWIRNSGIRYVDFASALSDVTGWVSDDNVHPSAIGGRFMALQVLADLPEIQQGK